jgi:uncharacterized repeat protein (TIGR01451 family)
MRHGTAMLFGVAERPCIAILCVVLTLTMFMPHSATAAELVVNGGFESGDFSGGWVDGAGSAMGPLNPNWADHLVSLDMPATGNYSALLGFKYTEPQRHRYGFMYYDVTIPTGVSSAMLGFTYRQQGYDGVGRDPFNVEIRDTNGNTLATVLSFAFPERTGVFKDSGWLQAGYDMAAYAGQTVRIYFEQINSVDNRYETWVFVDDVSLEAAGWVDLIIDGDGNDLFGAPGTGSGGVSLRSTEAGMQVSYILEIENEGPVSDSFVLSGVPPAGWALVLRYGGIDYTLPWTTPSVPSAATIAADVILTVPPGEPLGGYQTVIDAVSISAGDRYDSVTLGTNIVPAPYQPDLVIEGDGLGLIDQEGAEGGSAALTAPPDTTVEYAVELVNSGTEDDTFRIWWVGDAPLTAVVDDGGTVHAGAFTTAVIPMGGSIFLTLRVTVPLSVTGGIYETLLFSQSVSDSLKQDGVTAATTVLAPAVDMIISGSGDDIVDPTGQGLGGSATAVGIPGLTVLFPIVIQNEGTVPDSFRLTWTRPANRWTAVITDGVNSYPFPWTTPLMAPGEERTYFLAVTISDRADYTSYLSILDAVSMTDGTVGESVSAIVTVGSVNEIDLWIEGNGDDIYGPLGTGLGGFASRVAGPGETLFFTITLENESGADLFDLSWTVPPGWEVLIGDSTSTMRGVPSGVYVLEVRLPALCTEGTFDIILDGRKVDKPYLVDSVTGSIIVTASHAVDALIDGNGDDIYGTPGVGDGGLSQRSVPAGTRANFVLELQNEGSGPESYEISWSAPPGWAAWLDGNTSPATTGQVTAGGSTNYTFEVDVPPAVVPGDYDLLIDVVSTIDPNCVESVTARVSVISSTSYVLVTVFDDADHDGIYDAGEVGLGGVTVRVSDPGGDIAAVTGAAGTCLFEVDAGVPREAMETTPSGYYSLSPDTVSVPALAVGDTVRVYFADVMGPVFVPSNIVNAPAGGFADVSHTITAGTAGQAVVTVIVPAGWVETFYRDNNGDGLLDPGDTILTAADLDLDPAVPGRDIVPVILRVFIPSTVPAGTVEVITVTLVQTFSGTSFSASVSVFDQIQVLAAASGLLRLVKEVDLAAAQPGEVITYTIIFSNPGTESVREIEIIDMLPPEVDIVTDVFGPGQDIAWVAGAVTTYLTADPTDPDEALYSAAARSLQVILSRQVPFTLGPGEEGRIIYRVSIR